MTPSQFNFDENQTSTRQTLSIDYKRIFFRALTYWYFLALSLAVGLVSAYLINRYSTRIYPVRASIIIRQGEDRSDARFLYNNPLVNPYRNFYNELYVLRSYPIVQKTVEELSLYIMITKEGSIKSSEFYKLLPIEIEVLDSLKSIQHNSFVFEPISNDRFNCSPIGDDLPAKSFAFGEAFNCNGISLRIKRVGDLQKWMNARYDVTIQTPEEATAYFVDRLKASWAEQGASVVNLEISGPIASKNADFLTQLIKSYQQFDLNKKNMSADRSIDFIDRQLTTIQDSLADAEQALENFQEKNSVGDLSEEASRIYMRLQELEINLAAYRVQDKYYSYLEKYLNETSDGDQVVLPTAFGIYDPVLNALLAELVELQLNVKLMPKKELSNPLVSGSKERIKEIKANVKQSIDNLKAATKIQNEQNLQQVTALERQLKQLPDAERKLVNLKRSYTLNEGLYVFLMEKRAEAGISRASNSTDIMVVNPPKRGGATTPKGSQNYTLGFVFGLLFPFAIFFLSEVLNDKIQSKEDIEKITSIPFIGGIGHNMLTSSLVVHERPKASLSESFRALRSNLNYFTQGLDKKVFMITSSLSGEGKTFTTINLATVFALSGKKTIIVGADLRRPKIFGDFGLRNEKGLSTFLSGMCTREEIIQETQIENLHLVSGGPVPPNPSELIMNPRMSELFHYLKEQYDFILVDTPPIALVSEAFELSEFADHSIFLVRQSYTPKAVLKNLDEYYRIGKLKKMSIVFNDIHRSGFGYGYGYGYGYHYGYGYGKSYGAAEYYDESPRG